MIVWYTLISFPTIASFSFRPQPMLTSSSLHIASLLIPSLPRSSATNNSVNSSLLTDGPLVPCNFLLTFEVQFFWNWIDPRENGFGCHRLCWLGFGSFSIFPSGIGLGLSDSLVVLTLTTILPPEPPPPLALLPPPLTSSLDYITFRLASDYVALMVFYI